MKKLVRYTALILAFFANTVQAQISGDILTIGDSLTAGLAGARSGVITCAALNGAVVAADRQRTCKGNGQRNIGGWQPRLAALSQVNVFNFGNSGERTSEMLARLDSHLASRPSAYVLILGGTNDAIFGTNRATTISNLTAMINKVKTSGRIAIIGTLPPLLGGRFAGSNGNIVALNNAIKAMPDVEVADHYAALVGSWSQNTSGDFIHLGVNGNMIVADGWFQAIQRTQVVPEPEPEVTKPAAIVAPVIGLLL